MLVNPTWKDSFAPEAQLYLSKVFEMSPHTHPPQMPHCSNIVIHLAVRSQAKMLVDTNKRTTITLHSPKQQSKWRTADACLSTQVIIKAGGYWTSPLDLCSHTIITRLLALFICTFFLSYFSLNLSYLYLSYTAHSHTITVFTVTRVTLGFKITPTYW